jgi:hypothetical protein
MVSMVVQIESQYFMNIVSYSTLLKSSHIDFSLCDSFRKMSFRNRCVISTANGLLSLTVPILGGRSVRAPFSETRIDHSSPWQERHWRSIFTAYGNSPWFFHYGDSLELLFRRRETFLADWNQGCFEWLNDAVGVSLSVANDPSEVERGLLDLRDLIRPNNFQDPDLGPFPIYPQVFEEKNGFQPNLSMLDLVLNMGKSTLDILAKVASRKT